MAAKGHHLFCLCTPACDRYGAILAALCPGDPLCASPMDPAGSSAGLTCAGCSAPAPLDGLWALCGEGGRGEHSWQHMAAVPARSNCSVNSESGGRSLQLQPAAVLRNPITEPAALLLPAKILHSSLPNFFFSCCFPGEVLLCLLLPPTPPFSSVFPRGLLCLLSDASPLDWVALRSCWSAAPRGEGSCSCCQSQWFSQVALKVGLVANGKTPGVLGHLQGCAEA